MEFEFFGIGLALSGDEHPSSEIAAQACELELQKQKECSFGEWERDSADQFKWLLGNIVYELQPSEHGSAVRLEVIKRLSMLLGSSAILRGTKISPFGSFESNFYSEWADLDLSLELPQESKSRETIGKSRKVKILKSFMKILMKQAEARKVQFIPYARVPLLTFEDPRYNISCDVSVDNGVAIFKSRLLRWISNIDSRCRDLIFLVKCWAKAHCINDPKTGTLNSFALCLLVIFHLQTRSPPVLPPLNAVLHEDIARKFSGRSSQIWREQLLNSCWEKIEPLITLKFGAQNRSSLAELFVSFFCQFSSVSRLWLEGLVACPFIGTWGDPTSTCRQWRSKHYVMAVEDPFDRLENCARSVQEYSFPGVIHAFSSTAEAFKHPSLCPDLQSLLEILFGWPEGLQKQGIRMWLLKVYSREGKVAQVHFPKRVPGEGSSSKKVVACRSYRPMQTVDADPQRNGIVQDRGINIIDQSHRKKDLAASPVNPYPCNLENHFGDQGGEQLVASNGKLHQRGRTRKIKGLQAGGEGMQPIFSETSLVGGLITDWKSPNTNVLSTELESFIHQEETSRTWAKRMSNSIAQSPQYPLESNTGTLHSGFSETNEAGTETTVELSQKQSDEEVDDTKTQSLSRTDKSRQRRGRNGAGNQEIIASSLPDIHIPDRQTSELPSDGKDVQTFEGKHGTRQGNIRRLLKNTSNHLCVKGNTRYYSSAGPETKKQEVPSERKGRLSNNLAQGNAEGTNRGHGKPAAQRGWEKPAEQLSRAKSWMQMMEQNEERKPLIFDQEDSVHILTGNSGHTTVVEGLESMRVSDFQSRQKFDRLKYHKNKGFGEQLWRPKCQD